MHRSHRPSVLHALIVLGIFTCTSGQECSTSGVTTIPAIQGTVRRSPLVGDRVSTIGTIIGTFQEGAEPLGGFFLQDAEGDSNTQSSDAIFVNCATSACRNLRMGDIVRLQGDVLEDGQLTQLESVSNVQKCGRASGGYQNTGISPVEIHELPISKNGTTRSIFFEKYEGMLVTIPGTLTVAEVYNLGAYGQVLLSQGGRPFIGTNIAQPGEDAQAVEDSQRLLLLDDSSYTSKSPNPIVYPNGGLTASNTLRVGYTVTDATGILTFGCRTRSDCNWRLLPVTPSSITFTASNPRQPAPSVSGNFKVGSMNVLNFFNGDGRGEGFPTSRGADTREEFSRQQAKIVSAINAMDADVVVLVEIENDGSGTQSAIQDLTDALNADADGDVWNFIQIPKLSGDVISIKLIYKPDTATPVGRLAVLDNTVDIVDFNSRSNRPVVAHAFRDNSSGETFVVAGAHFKSKGSECYGDPDLGQGNCNQVRTKAANATLKWLEQDPTNTGMGSRFLLAGDLNAYAMEDPIKTLKEGGMADLLQEYEPQESRYSYVYKGRSGYLDHALATAGLAEQIIDAAIWHINADEPPVLDYNTEQKSAQQKRTLYADDPYRSSDHDPVIVGFNFAPSETKSP